MTKLTLGLVPIARPTFDVPLAVHMMLQARQLLEGADFTLIGPDDLVMDADDAAAALDQLKGAEIDLLVLLQASFADSSMALELAQAVDAPLLLWAVPEERVGGRLRLNSFCGINLAAHGLKRAGIGYEYLYAPPASPEALATITATALAGSVVRKLKGARIGRVGDHPNGFDTCRYDAAALNDLLGLEVERLEIEDLFARAKAVPLSVVAGIEDDVKQRVTGLEEMEPEPMHGTLATYVALRDTAREDNLQGMAVRCWPEFFSEMGCSACGAMSMMSDGGVPSSCEADVNGTITQLMLQWLSGEPAFGTDMVDFDVAGDTAVFWHCGLAPMSMADPDAPIEAALHSNRQKPLLLQFPLKPGRVTVARLSEASGSYCLAIGAGEMLKAPAPFTGTSGTFRFDSGTQAAMDTLLREGLEHHVAITYGDHTASLEALARMLGLDVVRL